MQKYELSDIQINLHASFVNAYGFFDNIAGVCVFESDAESKLNRTDVGLFQKKTHVYLPRELQDVVQTEEIRNWYFTYARNFRDALAHRISPYVPPSQITSEEQEAYEELERKIAESFRRE